MKVKRLRDDELYHHGVKGQRWGIRRYQNPDGTLTETGRRRYAEQTGKSFLSTAKKVGTNYSPTAQEQAIAKELDKDEKRTYRQLESFTKLKKATEDLSKTTYSEFYGTTEWMEAYGKDYVAASKKAKSYYKNNHPEKLKDKNFTDSFEFYETAESYMEDKHLQRAEKEYNKAHKEEKEKYEAAIAAREKAEKEFANELIGSYKNTKVKTYFGEDYLSNLTASSFIWSQNIYDDLYDRKNYN